MLFVSGSFQISFFDEISVVYLENSTRFINEKYYQDKVTYCWKCQTNVIMTCFTFDKIKPKANIFLFDNYLVENENKKEKLLCRPK